MSELYSLIYHTGWLTNFPMVSSYLADTGFYTGLFQMQQSLLN